MSLPITRRPVVEPGERPTWFYVQSRTTNDRHFVRLEAYRGNGACDCRGFIFHREELVARGASPCDRNRCWHIRRAREWLLDRIIIPQLVRHPNQTAPL